MIMRETTGIIRTMEIMSFSLSPSLSLSLSLSIYIWLTAVGSGGTTLGGELCRFLDLVGHGAKFDQTESCGSSVERGPG